MGIPKKYTALLSKGPIAWMVHNPVAANLVIVFCLIGGFLIFREVRQEVFPVIEPDYVQIVVSYPAATPEEVEKGIVLPIEEAITGIDDIKTVISAARENVGTVAVEMIRGGDIKRLYDNIKNAVDRITTFPQGAEKPEVFIVSLTPEVIRLAIYANVPQNVLRSLAHFVKQRLLEDPLITRVDFQGIPNPEISIQIDQNTLQHYRLTLQDVANQIRSSSLDLSSGVIKSEGGEILIRVNDRLDYASQFRNLPILTPRGKTPVRLGDIAQIKETVEETDREAFYNGIPAVMLIVYRTGRHGPIEVSRQTKMILQELSHQLPSNVQIAILNDNSKVFFQRMRLLLKNAIGGLIIVLFLLSLFLELKLAFWVAMGIPVSFLASSFFLRGTDVSINMVSLFAFIIALGIVVDDAIVVGENIYTWRERIKDPILAAIAGTREVATPVHFSVLTNIVAFVPLWFLPGVTGKIFSNIPAVVCPVFLVSLLESIFILPAHLAHIKQNGPQESSASKGLFSKVYRILFKIPQQKFNRWFERMVSNGYGRLITTLLHWRYATVATSIVLLLVIVAWRLSGRITFVQFPVVEADVSVATVELTFGISKNRSEEVMNHLVRTAQKILDRYPGLGEGIFAEIGGGGVSGPHTISVRVYLADPDKRPIPTLEFTELWRKETGPILGAKRISFEADRGGPGAGKSITLELYHRDWRTLELAAQQLGEEFKKFNYVQDVDDGLRQGKQEVRIQLTDYGRSLGLTSAEVARQLRSAFYGAEAIRQLRGEDEIKVMVRYPEDLRTFSDTFQRFLIRTPAYTYVPLLEVAQITWGYSFVELGRRNGLRKITVDADVRPRVYTEEVVKGLKSNVIPVLIEKFPGLQVRFEGRQADVRDAIDALQKGLIFVLILIYAMLAIPFRSYFQPIIIMVSIPFGIIGAILGHIIMGYPLSMPSLFGIMALSGVVINDAIVLIDFANNRRQNGLPLFQALKEAGIARFRAIILTTLTTFGGLMPIIFETERQARFLIPMAISLGFGVLFSTVITLLLIPCLYLVLEDIFHLLGWETMILVQPQLLEDSQNQSEGYSSP